MKRIIFVLLFFCSLAFFWQDLLGLSLRVIIRLGLKAELAYRDLHIVDGQLLLEDAVLFDVSGGKSTYLISADSIRVTWEKWLTFFVQFDQCSITSSAEVCKHRLRLANSSWITYRLEISEGRIDWSDRFLPPSTFSLIDNKLDVEWERGGVISAGSTQTGFTISFSQLPLHLILPEAHGMFDGMVDLTVQKGSIAGLSLRMQGKDLSCDLGLFHYGGSFSLDWEAGKIPSLNPLTLAATTNRLRLSVEEGAVAEVLKNGKFLVTFQAGLGGKWEGTAETQEGLPLAVAGKLFDGEQKLVTGTARFGEAEAVLTQNAGKIPEHWILEWSRLGIREVACLQDFIARFEPRISQCEWTAGTASGTFQLNAQGKWQVPIFQAMGLHLRIANFETACKQLSFKQGDWEVEELAVKTILPVLFQGNGRFETSHAKGYLEGSLGDSEVRIFYDQANLFGSLGEFIFEGKFEGQKLSVPRFGGKVPSWLAQIPLFEEVVLSSGRMSSMGDGFIAFLDGRWSLACKLEQAALQVTNVPLHISSFHCEVYADPEGVDVVAAGGTAEVVWGGKSFATQLIAPRIQCHGMDLVFDIRMVEKEWDWLRLAGKKKGDYIALDPARSFLLGSPLHVQGPVRNIRIKSAVSWRLLESLLARNGCRVPWGSEFDGTLQLSVNTVKGMHIALESTDLTWGRAKVGDRTFMAGPCVARCQLHREREGWQIQSGLVNWGKKVSFSFEGKVNDSFNVNGVIDHLCVDLSQIEQFPVNSGLVQGVIEGKGCFSIQSQFEADLDMSIKDLSVGEYAIENSGPLYFSINSSGSAYLKGIESKVSARSMQAHVTTDLVKMDWKEHRIKASKIRAVSPTNLLENSIFDPDREIVLFGDAEIRLDGTDWTCALQEGFLPLAGAVRNVKDCRMGSDSKSYGGSGRLIHQDKEALVSWKISELLQGKVILQEVGETQSMLIEGCYKDNDNGKKELSIYSVEGAFAGIDASFRAIDRTQLVGSAQINFKQLSNWIPDAVSDVFHDLDMEGGYEIKGHLNLSPEDFSFRGLFCGKDIDLFGFQLRTLMAQADFGADHISLKDLLISDDAGSLVIPEMLLQGKNEPWTIDIPILTIRDLRPSLLQKPGQEKKELTPLVVRELKIRDFKGLLEDGATYRASGDLTFINSFKRGKSVFDLPTHLFGRIVGLDLELLIPVEGRLLFELDKGYFTLTDLQESFSEGRRSQFFLAEQEVPPRMSLRGDLEIFVRMKHFVLFALTEAFMISVDGKLSDPQFHLQKKKNLL